MKFKKENPVPPRERVRAALYRAFSPPERISPAEWCEKHVSEIPYSPIPGPFRSENSPMISDVMNAIVDPAFRTVSIVASIQSSKTLAPELTLCYIIANMPGPTLWLDTTDANAKNESESRLQPLMEATAPVKALFPLDKNKKRNAAIFFQGGFPLWILGANNKRNLQSRSIRWLFGDETWLWAPGRMTEAEARVSAFGRLGKCVFFSQAGTAGDDTDLKFQSSTQNEWCFSCPHCGKVQPFKWENVRWDSAAKDAETGKWDLRKVRASAKLFCEECGAAFEDNTGTRTRLNKTARFVAQNDNPAHGVVGFHWNALASMSWGVLAEMFLRAMAEARNGNPDNLKAFYQKRLAVPWKEDDEDFSAEVFTDTSDYHSGDTSWELEGVADSATRRFIAAADWRGAPDAPRLRFMTVDVQDGYFYFVVRSWSPSGDSRMVICGLAQRFEDLAEIRERWCVPARFLFLDGGFMTQRVAEFAARHGAIVLMGDRVAGRATFRHADKRERVYSPRRLIKLSRGGNPAESYYFSNLSCKDKLVELRRNEGNAWKIPSDVPADYLKQMGNEYRSENGVGKPIWLRKGNRPNHYFDCETMQVAAAFLVGLFEKPASS